MARSAFCVECEPTSRQRKNKRELKEENHHMQKRLRSQDACKKRQGRITEFVVTHMHASTSSQIDKSGRRD